MNDSGLPQIVVSSELPTIADLNSQLARQSLEVFTGPNFHYIQFESFMVYGDSIFIPANVISMQPPRRLYSVYEFSRWGEFVRRLNLSLVHFSPDGISEITHISPGEISIQRKYIPLL